MSTANNLVCNLEDMHTEIALNAEGVKLNMAAGLVKYVKVRVLGAQAPLKIVFEYVFTNGPSVAKANFINVFTS